MKKIINNVFFLSLLLIMTFMDSYRVFPSKYRPLFLWVLIILFPLALLKERKISKNILYLFIAYLYMSIISSFRSIFIYKSFQGFLDYSIPATLCLIAYISYKFIFENIDLLKLEKAFYYSGNILIFIGILEILSYYGILPITVKVVLNNILTQGYSARFKLITNEASWASMLLLFYYSYFLTKKKRISYFLVMLLIILSFSTQGIISLFIYNLYIYLKKFKKSIFIIFYLVMAVIFFVILFEILKELVLFLNMENTYFGSRFFKIKLKSFEEFLNIDGSIFVRIGYPLAALKIWTKDLSNFFIGIGGGNYIFEFEDAIKKVSSSYINYREVMLNMNSLSANVKNLYIRLAVEGGLVTLYLMFRFIALTREKLIKINKEFLNNLFIVLIIIYLQFDSYVYLLFPMILALIDTYYEKIKKLI